VPVAEGALIASVGTLVMLLLTVNVVLGPVRALTPARLFADPAFMLIPIVPSPDMPVNVTVREMFPLPVIEIVSALAEPVVLRAISSADRVMWSALV